MNTDSNAGAPATSTSNDEDTLSKVYHDPALADEQSLRELIQVQQLAWSKARGSQALANMVADAYVAIQKVLHNADAKSRVNILVEYGITPATGGTSKFSPWIKVQWGEYHATEKFTDAAGVERRTWVPDRSMEVYYHTMERLEELGVRENHANFIMEQGGAQKMAADRKTARAKPDRDRAENEAGRKRDFMLEEDAGTACDLPVDMPSDTGEFFTVLFHKTPDGVRALGVANKQATSAANTMAQARYDGLKQRKQERERQAREAAAVQKRIDEQAEQMVTRLSQEQLQAMRDRIAAEKQRQPEAVTA